MLLVEPTALPDVKIIQPKRFGDHRGFFSETYSRSAFAEAGGAPRSVEEHLSLAANTAARHAGAYPDATFFMASGRVAHEAGGSAAQELAFAASSVVAHVKAAVDAGMSVEAALKGTVLGLSVGDTITQVPRW